MYMISLLDSLNSNRQLFTNLKTVTALKKPLFQNIPHLSTDNKSRQFSFKLLHCILVQNTSDSEDCFFLCKSTDFLELAFLECPAGLNFF